MNSTNLFCNLVRELWFSIVQLPEKHLIERFSPYGGSRFINPRAFDWTKRLEENWKVIRFEFDQVVANEHLIPNFQEVSNHISITDDGKWKTYFLYCYGHKIGINCKRCPRTTQLIEQVPGMTTAFFSILHPKKHIPEHRGPYKGVLRYHLGLKVPKPHQACRIRVDEEIAYWGEGKSLMFDDTYPHEVWNDADESRAVLFMDIIRPLPEPLAFFNRGFLKLLKYSPPVIAAVKNGRIKP